MLTRISTALHALLLASLAVCPAAGAACSVTFQPESCAVRVEPALVGLHLHCWGGSLNGGYGWWHNAHRGAVLIAANQVPYDWWTGYHEALGTCRTWGDGRVHPRRCQRFQLQPGAKLVWTNRSLAEGKVIQSHAAMADQWGLVTLEQVVVAKGKNRIRIARRP